MKKVLIVDDEPNIIMSLEFLMKKNGYEVFIARNGAEAIKAVDRERPDIVILDIMMPHVDGYEVCEYIKQQKITPVAKVIFLSAKGKESDIAKGYEVGADFYMTKPFSTKNLVNKINELTVSKP
ncbi:response regulator [Fulvivirga sp. M361]|uniref:response regulator transcription factor n=1 Tax=Fulvivirga sp. M361 TaxID=2594266 RepID=UPI00117B6514|nr:response regulator [Fulvivirga sp. M361]TRX50883.1 response regulator [Fulvivirga sp. M361]